MKHKCQSSLVRCALRGQHPRYVVYRLAGLWVIFSPLNGHLVAVHDAAHTPYARVMRIARNFARRGRYDHGVPSDVVGEVPC